MSTVADCWVANVYLGGCWPLAERIPVAASVLAIWIVIMLIVYVQYRRSNELLKFMANSAPRNNIFWIFRQFILAFTPHPTTMVIGAVALTVVFAYILAKLLLVRP